MARGWHGNSEGHAKAGQLGGRKSAANRRRRSQFGERLPTVAEQAPKRPEGAKPHSQESAS